VQVVGPCLQSETIARNKNEKNSQSVFDFTLPIYMIVCSTMGMAHLQKKFTAVFSIFNCSHIPTLQTQICEVNQYT